MARKNVALVTDWAYGGGSEKVVEQLHKMFPDAPIYTSYCSDKWRKKLDGKVVTGYLQHPPFRQLRKFLSLLRQFWFARLDLSEFDLVISVTGNGEAKFARVPNGKHVCYCNTPVHFYWRHYEQYVINPGFRPKWLARLGLKLLVSPLKKRDYRAAQNVDYFIANSSHIQKDIKKFYGRDSAVIYPPVNVKRSQTKDYGLKTMGYFITMGRQVPHKRIDIIVQACTNLGLPLKVIGGGPEHDKLIKMAGPSVEFLGQLADKDIPKHLAAAEAFIFASYDDFGISPVEAMAAGTPVIAYKAGGALDYVVPGKTGMFFNEQSVASLEKTLKIFYAKNYSSDDIKKQTRDFDSAQFRKKFSQFLQDTLQ